MKEHAARVVPSMNAALIRRKLSGWFGRHGRDLPWRRTCDPYAILVSEFMLQQTTVAAVIPYFERWMKEFPTVAALARADEQAVLTHWQGLGYYRRARNLHAAAQMVVARHDGRIPQDVAMLRALPGVGNYTAAAVGAFAFDASEPVVDANIARVLARVSNWQKPIDNAAGKAFLADCARALLPDKGGRLHASALMELGALVCTARAPRCPRCPIRAGCRAERPGELPHKRARTPISKEQDARAFIFFQRKIWLESSSGKRWTGLWLLPSAKDSGRAPDHVETYSITRFRVTMRVFAEARSRPALTGFSPEKLPPMPSPHQRAVAAMLRTRHTAISDVRRTIHPA